MKLAHEINGIIFRMSEKEEKPVLEDVEEEQKNEDNSPNEEEEAADEEPESTTTLHEVDVMNLVKHMGLQQRFLSS